MTSSEKSAPITEQIISDVEIKEHFFWKKDIVMTLIPSEYKMKLFYKKDEEEVVLDLRNYFGRKSRRAREGVIVL